MISYVKGILIESSPTRIVVDVQGIGYEIFIPLSSYENLPDQQKETKVFTYQHVREDALDLYGFLTIEEREVFKTLLGVNGIGAKLAMGILSGIAIDDLCEAIAQSNVKRLSSVPGLGKKTAERLVVELKDKIVTLSKRKISVGQIKTIGNKIYEDVTDALVALGYKSNAAEEALQKVLSEKGTSKLKTEDLVRKALQYVS
ncbi:MAG: Holliday junction branch migration protein RuvA [Candidatus Ancaeobacter aquaticus]|nr:Holliday junction branch migration protein RuvA [Candidatus Ancaeobacter aquaticus]